MQIVRLAFLTAGAVLVPLAVMPSSASAAPAAVTPARYSLTNLGTLSTSATAMSEAKGINNAGVVVGDSTAASGSAHAFRWSAGTMTDLGVETGGVDSEATAINDAGQVAGTADRSGGGYAYPVRWSASGVLQDLGGSITNELGVGNAIDPAGKVAGGQRGAQSEDGPNAMLYDTSGGRIALGNPPESLGAANGINARDQVVGSPGFLWQPGPSQGGSLTMLPGLDGAVGRGSNALAINIRGQIVGTSSVPNTFNTHAVRWDGSSLNDIGTLDGIQYSQANAINAAGEVVGTADPMCQPCAAPRAWIWRPGGTITALDTLIAAGSGWTLERAFGINDRGQIVGSGRINGGPSRAFLLTPAYTVSINFQPASAPVPVGYIPDTGAVSGTRFGYTYGWSVDDSAMTRDRNSTASWDQRYDTLIHAAQPSRTNYWELYVPNGTYVVHTASGDPSYTDSVHVLLCEGQVIASGTPTTAHPWIEGTLVVTVTDNHLTISNAPSSNNDKLNYIDVHTA